MDERTIELFARKSGLMELSGAYMKAGLFEGSNMVIGDAMMEFAKMCREYKEPESETRKILRALLRPHAR